MKLITCNDLTLGYEGKAILSGLNFTVNSGDYLCIVGENGSGKSTLLRCATMLETMDSGEIVYLGKKAVWSDENGKLNYADKKDLKEIQSQYGLVFQNFNLLSRTTALENVMMPAVYAHPALSMKAMRERSVELLNLVGLSDRMDHTPAQLSGGQQQRVAIARSLINNPSILLADEPTGNLDSTTSKEVLHMFKDLNRQQGITVILVTHDPKIAAFTDRAINMADGLICEGISDMLSKDDV